MPSNGGQGAWMRVVAIAGAKGGVGKTAVAVNLAMLASAAG